MNVYRIISVPADGLALLSAMPSAGTTATKFESGIYQGSLFLTWIDFNPNMDE